MLKEGRETQNISIDQLAGGSFGPYHIEKLLGRGELSTVYIAQQPAQGRKVMITMFKFPAGTSTLEQEQLCARFTKEASILVRLAHPNIVSMYDFGVLFGHPYLVTAFVKGGSLRQLLRQQGRLTPQQILVLLKQIASALDYAHRNGVVHDLLSLSNVVINQDSTAQIVGFGLKTVVEAHRGVSNNHLQTFSQNDSFMVSLQALGVPLDTSYDIYALGMILFELLSGTMPFSENSSTISRKYLQSPAPSIHAVCPEVPEAVDIVISRALERDPAKRYAHAGDIVLAFERVLSVLGIVPKSGMSSSPDRQRIQSTQVTLPPTVNWFDETGKWQAPGPAITARNEPAARPSSPLVTVMPKNAPMPVASNPDSIVGVDPFSLWSATNSRVAVPPVSPPTAPAGTFPSQARPQPQRVSRRKVVSLLAVGVAGVGVLAVGGVSLAHVLQNQQTSSTTANMAATTTKRTGAPYHTKATPATQAKKAAQAAPTQQPKPQPTPTPAQTHMGMAIGYTSQASNSAKTFTNPADGMSSLLIRLPNGNFVAAERACTHQQVLVDYDPTSHMIVCPAHGAVFDPAHNFSHVSGPGNGPLKVVIVRMNADGTITTA